MPAPAVLAKPVMTNEALFSGRLLMSNSNLTLGQFIKPVPVFTRTDDWDTLKKIFQSGQDEAIVLLSEQQFPLGYIPLIRLWPYFGGEALPSAPKQTQLPQRLRSNFSPDALLETLTVLSVHTSIEEFTQQLKSSHQQPQHNRTFALVDAQEQFLGLLDHWRLLQSILPLLEKAQPQPCVTPQSATIKFHPLLQLMEQLPLPLMLETSTGQVISQNSAWRSQIGATISANSVPHGATSQVAKSLLASPLQLATAHARQQSCQSAPKQATQPYCQKDNHHPLFNVLSSQYEYPLPGAETAEFAAHIPQQTSVAKNTWQFIRIPLYMGEIGSDEPWVIPDSQSNLKQWSQTRQVGENLPPTHQTHKGSRYPFSLSSSPLWLILATDITEKEQLCKELAAKNADLVQLNRLKDEFLACISHELKSPLTAVVGLSSLLKDQSLGKLNQRQARYAGLIYQSGHHLMMLVNDILDLTRLETGQLKLTFEPVQIRSVCERAYQQAYQLQSFKSQSQEEARQKLKFTLEIEPSLEIIVADELRLRQMLTHLLDNAFKFTEDGGEIGLKVSNWEGWIALNVWDTGIGIPPTSQHLIFQKFQQLENPLTRRFEGTGLGLVLTQRLARAHGGDISFTSKAGEGSEFTLLLPPHPPELEQSNQTEGLTKIKPESSPPQPASNLVLVVEAVPRYIEDLTAQIRELGYRVVIARSGTEALEKARQLQPCTILLNPLLPLLSGWDVLVLLKSDPVTSEIPIVVTATSGEKQRALRNGADGFLSLPVVQQDLRSNLARLSKQPNVQPKSLTILLLNPHVDTASPWDLAAGIFSEQLNYRILEANDLEQAELLAQVWHPDAVVVNSSGWSNAYAYLERFSQLKSLAALPLITLDAQTTQAANRVKGLAVFPCLITPGKGANRQKLNALLEVIQISVGMGSQPHILVYECGETSIAQEQISTNSASGYQWVQALIQYLQTAGWKSSLSHSWTEVYSQIQYQSADLLVLNLEVGSANHNLIQQLQQLTQLVVKPPVLVLDNRLEQQNSPQEELEQLLQSVATKIVRGHNQSMRELLEEIKQMVNH